MIGAPALAASCRRLDRTRKTMFKIACVLNAYGGVMSLGMCPIVCLGIRRKLISKKKTGCPIPKQQSRIDGGLLGIQDVGGTGGQIDSKHENDVMTRPMR